ncbi:SDR family oxidoreductase [Frankia sp. CNm7]|uniref:SDR family oxidoreductase n=1 Tax=Frankia nepalensis TaxID=1836974 RepID=A0A937RQQ5_9ACTN|nr:SDR family oxidoreductase [Frankia nepalensis]MBL7498680.1 SDR family oxidoreductase [Frankia nepalensis]MBL7509155.1 SDR family oxidoreductase [Frankia nepalensis]MBL7518777.1 SDR family oxidoreductase [Frankia nepalensis]MBL7633235.1 SDR family oxidoreductase [Frankia nepalensis]
MRVVVVGASSGLGRSIGLALAGQGARVALLARRRERLEKAAAEAGEHAVPIVCDVTDPASCQAAVAAAADALGGIDGLVYASATWTAAPIEQTDADTWARLFATNVTGAALVTAAALPHLAKAGGAAVYLSSVSASMGPPWPLIGAYATSKAALDKLVEAWRTEHPAVGFTRLSIGDCLGGDGHSATGIIAGADQEVLGQAVKEWTRLGYFTGNFIDVEHLVEVTSSVLRCGKSSSIPSITLVPRVLATHAS